MWLDVTLGVLVLGGIAFLLCRFCRYDRAAERKNTAEYNEAHLADKKPRQY